MTTPDSVGIGSNAEQLRLDGRTLSDCVVEARAIMDAADERYPDAVKVTLFSGGNDSSVVLDLTKHRCDFVVHVNTGIGIEDTRRFVRARVADLGLRLVEEHPPGLTYREMVLKWGFPGPSAHLYMYRHLKERALRKVVRETLPPGRDKRIIFYSGVRLAESQRRMLNFKGKEIERAGRTVWVAPVAFFSAADMAAYRLRFGVPQNEVSANLHMSGECLCGAFARPGELDEIKFFYPEAAAEISALEDEVAAAGLRSCKWGQGRALSGAPVGRLCSSCTLFDPDEKVS